MADSRTEAVDKIMIYSPRVNQLKAGYTPDLIGSEKKQVEFDKVVKKMAKEADMEFEYYTTFGLRSNDTEMLNDISLINQYIIDYFEYASIDKVPFTSLSGSLEERLGKGKVLFTSMTEMKKRPFHGGSFFKVLGIYSIPDVISKIIKPERRVKYEHLLVDMEKQEVLFYEYSTMFGRNDLAQMQSKYYNLFFKLQNL